MLSSPRALLGKTIGGYHLSRMIGVGGTGAVFLGADDGREVAVKILIPPLLTSEESLKEFYQRFQREAKILSQLHHPYILPVQGFGTDEEIGLPYMLMPYKSGGTLVEQIERGPLPFEKVIKYVQQLALALSYAHEQNIIHRDIKPANVLLDEQGDTSLADFGIAKLFNLTTTTLTTANQMLGTPAYMAPEQVSNKPISPATDIYGLGVLTYQLLTGTLPFDVSTLLALLQRIVQENPPPPHGLRPGLPPAASEVLFKAMAKHPETRFSSALSFALALEQSMREVLASPTGTSLVAYMSQSAYATQPRSAETPTVAAEEQGAGDVNNDPTLLAHYDAALLQDDQASDAVANSQKPAVELDATIVAVGASTIIHKNNLAVQSAQNDALHGQLEQVEDGDAEMLHEDHGTLPLELSPRSLHEDATPRPLEEQIELKPTGPLDETAAPAPVKPAAGSSERHESIGAAASIATLQQPLADAPSLLQINTPAPTHDDAAEPNSALLVQPAAEKGAPRLAAGIRATVMKTPVRLRWQRPWQRWQIIAAAILVFLLAGEGLFSLYAYSQGLGAFTHQDGKPTPLPPATSASITIVPNSKTLQKTFIVLAVTGLPDANQHQVLARWIYNTTLPVRRTVSASGKVSTPATTASGTLLFINTSFTGPVNIAAGTTLISRSDNQDLAVVLDEAVNLPPAPLNYTSSQQRPAQRVRAHAAAGGTAGNIAAQKFYFASQACIPASPVCYSASNDAPFIGGTDAQNYTYVQQSDIDAAARGEQAQAPDPQQVLQDQLSANEQWIIQPSCRPQTSSNHGANDKAANVTVTTAFNCSGESYDQKGAIQVARQELKEQATRDLGSDYTLSKDVEATFKAAELAENGAHVNVTIDTSGTWIFQLGGPQKQDLAKSMAGKKKLEVIQLLKEQKGIKNVDIQLNDGDLNTLPSDPQKITINASLSP